MEDDFAKEHGLLTEKELDEIEQRFRKTEEEGLKNMLKHFDRLHDKLFTFNNILIAGYFALSKIEKSISLATILIPFANLAILLFIEYRMMVKSRFEAEVTKKRPDELKRWGKGIRTTNLYSLLAIVTTLIVTIMFWVYLF